MTQNRHRHPPRFLFLLFLAAFIGVSSCDNPFRSKTYEYPEILLPRSMTAFAGEEFSHVINASDPQNRTLDLFADGLPAWLKLIPEENRLTGTPSREDAGQYQFEITADNGKKATRQTARLLVYASRSEYELQQKIETSIDVITPGLRGLSVAVIDGEGDLSIAFTGDMGPGLTHRRVDRESQFRIASVTKPMTAALILKLVDEGRLGLDDVVTDHYETQLPNANSITIRQLLSHTAGVFDHLNANVFWNTFSSNYSRIWTVEELVQFAVQNGSLFTPGTSYRYSNTGFCVLGAVVEAITEMELEEAYQTMLFDPMGLQHTLYDNFSSSTNPIENLARSGRAYQYHLSAAGASGAMVASPSDVASFGRQFYGGRYLSRELTDEISVNIGGRVGGQNYGLGTRIWNVSGIPHHGHTGSLMDYRSILMYIPEFDLSIAIHAHDTHTSWSTLVNDLFFYVVNNFTPKPVTDIYYIDREEEPVPEIRINDEIWIP